MNPQASSTDRSRPTHVLECLDSVQNYRLALLIAPCRTGKTTCLKIWAERWIEDGRWKIAWVSLSEQDNLPSIFLKDLENAVGKSVEKDSLIAVQDGDLEAGMTNLINHLAGSQENVALILDHYQTISSTTIHEAVQLLLDYLPPQVHIIIASQCEPPLALPRMRVRRQLLELGPEDLCCE